MDEFVVHVFNVKLLAAGSDVGIFIHVTLETAIDACHDPIAPEVELPSMDQQGVVDVALYYKGGVCLGS